MRVLRVALVVLVVWLTVGTAVVGVGPAAAQGCSAAYPDFCVPPAPPDLDCADIQFSDFTVLAPDPHGFDGNDNDGRGCEDSGRPRFTSQQQPTTTTTLSITHPDFVVTTTTRAGTSPMTAAAREPLVRTGSSDGELLSGAAVFVLAGMVLLAIGRRRPTG